MTDKELLDSIAAQIKAHQKNKKPPKQIIIPPTGNHAPPKGGFDGWVWPMPTWQGKPATISDNFRRHKTDDHRQHLGADVMYRNDSRQKRFLPDTTPRYHCLSNTVPMLAMGPGTIWFAGLTSTGWSVQIDHGASVGFPLVTYYTHMSKLFIPLHSKGPGGLEVPAGTQLGFVGNSPKGEDPNHAHIEFWDYSAGAGGDRVTRCLDPGLYLRCFGQVALP
jgi:murein DD-endopeptidase MepM/ murein hydrolase activator NlpD